MSNVLKFEVWNGNSRPVEGNVWAWKWGKWPEKLGSWTSEKSPDADFSTENAESGLRRLGNLLIIAIPINTQSVFGTGLSFDKVSIKTFKDENSVTFTPIRTATYYTVKNLFNVPRDFSNIPGGRKANYLEIHLEIGGGVQVG